MPHPTGVSCGEAAAARIADLEAALEAEQRARTAAEERAAALPARELTSLQSLFRQAVEENRLLATQLHAARARIAELEAAVAPARAAAPAAAAWRPSSAAAAPSAAAPPPAAVHSAPCSRPGSAGSAGQLAGGCPVSGMHPAKQALAARLGRAAEPAACAAARLPDRSATLLSPGWQRQHPPQPLWQHTVLTLPASLPPRAAVPEPAVPAAPPAVAAPPAAPAAGLQQVFAELRALQQRVQVAEQQLQQRSAPLAAVLPPQQQLQLQSSAPVRPTLPPQLGSSPGSRPGSPTLHPGSRGGSPAPRPSSPAARHAQHRENWQLIRTLKQRQGQLEAARLAALSATLAGATLGQPTGGAKSPPSPCAAGQPWRFDTRDPYPSAGQRQHQLAAARRQQAAPARPSSAGTWSRQQRFGSSAAQQSGAKGGSPMGWHAAARMQGSRSAQGSRGRRASPAVDRAAASGCERRRRRRSRSRQEEVDRLLMGGRPTTLAGRGGGGSPLPAGRRGGQGPDWVTPVVVA